MTVTNPIVPSPEQVDQWFDDAVQLNSTPKYYIATQAVQWGADQELEACVEWLDRNSPVIGGFHLRIDRRSKPPSLKKQALMALEDGDISPGASLTPVEVCIIRRALEQLDD